MLENSSTTSSRRIRSHLARSVAFLAILLAPILVLEQFDNLLVTPNHNVIRIRHARHFDGLDYLFVGNSYTYAGILPKPFIERGLEVYSLGIATAGPAYYEILVEDYLSSVSTKPRNLLVLVLPMTFSDMADNWVAYPMHRYLNTPIANEIVALRYGKLDDYPLLARNSGIKGMRNLKKWVEGHRRSEFDVSPGFRGQETSDKMFEEGVYDATAPLYTPLNDAVFRRDGLERLLSAAVNWRERGIHVAFYEMSTHLLTDFFPASFLTAYQAALDRLEDASFEVLRCDLDLPRESYRDIDHLNVVGAEKFTRSLLARLAPRAVTVHRQVGDGKS